MSREELDREIEGFIASVSSDIEDGRGWTLDLTDYTQVEELVIGQLIDSGKLTPEQAEGLLCGLRKK